MFDTDMKSKDKSDLKEIMSSMRQSSLKSLEEEKDHFGEPASLPGSFKPDSSIGSQARSTDRHL
jgi:hypothetical protein